MSVVDELVKGREAFEHREWAAAHDRLSAVDRSKLSQDDLVRLGMAAYLSGDDESECPGPAGGVSGRTGCR